MIATETRIPTISAVFEPIKVEHAKDLLLLVGRKHATQTRNYFWTTSESQIKMLEKLWLEQGTARRVYGKFFDLPASRVTFAGRNIRINPKQSAGTFFLFDEETQELIGRIENLAVPE